MKTSKFICILFIFLLLANSITGCGGGGGPTSTASVADSPASGNDSGGQTGTTATTPLADPPAAGNNSGGAVAASSLANLAWDVSTSPNVSGYKLYYGTSSQNYSNSINVGMATSYTLSSLAPGTYYFSVTAYDASGNESGFSNEASKIVL